MFFCAQLPYEVLFSFQSLASHIAAGPFFCEVSKIKDREFMILAMTQAMMGAGKTWTNPQVGAIIVQNQKILSKGYHHRFGAPHAEIDALAHLNDIEQARGATMYVTLEPCSHYGKTPPCAKRIVEVGIKRVVVGMIDPNPLVAGKGIEILQAAGIDVTILGTSLKMNYDYNFFYHYQRPVVTMKFAASIDGKINVGSNRTMLTGKESNHDIQTLRTTQQAILIGEHTLIVDAPQLTVRKQKLEHPPVRIVLVHDIDKFELNLPIFSPDAPTWLLSEHGTKKSWPAHIKVFVGQWTVESIMQLLYEQGIQSLLVEGGSYIHSKFLAADVVDRIIGYIAPVSLGGGGLPIARGLPMKSPENFRLVNITRFGEDVKLEYRRK